MDQDHLVQWAPLKYAHYVHHNSQIFEELMPFITEIKKNGLTHSLPI